MKLRLIFSAALLLSGVVYGQQSQLTAKLDSVSQANATTVPATPQSQPPSFASVPLEISDN